MQVARAKTGKELIRTVAICAGSGESSLKFDRTGNALILPLLSGSSVLKNVEADLYLTGEFGHVRSPSRDRSSPFQTDRSTLPLQHDILLANASGRHVITCNHSASERPWLQSQGLLLRTMMAQIGFKDDPTVGYVVELSDHDKEPLELL